MKTKEMRRIMEESFECTIEFDEERGINDHFNIVATLIDNSESIDSNSVFRGFLTGYGNTETQAIRNLYTAVRSITWKGVKQIGHEKG